MTKGFLTGLFVSLLLTTSTFAQVVTESIELQDQFEQNQMEQDQAQQDQLAKEVDLEVGFDQSNPSVLVFTLSDTGTGDYERSQIKIQVLNIVGNTVYVVQPATLIEFKKINGYLYRFNSNVLEYSGIYFIEATFGQVKLVKQFRFSKT